MSKSRSSGFNAVESLVPSSRLMRAAVSGLVAFGAGACSEDDSSKESGNTAQLSDEELDAVCESKVDDAVEKARADQDLEKLCSDMVADAKKGAQSEDKPKDDDLPKLCGDMVISAKSELEKRMSDLQGTVKMLEEKVTARDNEIKDLKEKGRSILLTTEEKTKTTEQKEYKYADLTRMCDERGGYTQVHGSCGGINACAGFSYGDWGPDAATLTEHTCSGVNGCTGLSCVVLPKDGGKSGKELYEDVEFAEPLGGCGGCHGGFYDDKKEWTKDLSRFAVFTLPGSTRTAENWLDRSAKEQERITAFGARGTLPDGTAYQNMAAYHGVLSRAETERVVAHIRTLTPFMWTIKTADPQ
jgi:hypothetical protein